MYAAWWRESMVAVKRFNRASDSIHELRMHTAVSSGDNQNVLSLKGYCRRDDAVFLIMEYCPRHAPPPSFIIHCGISSFIQEPSAAGQSGTTASIASAIRLVYTISPAMLKHRGMHKWWEAPDARFAGPQGYTGCADSQYAGAALEHGQAAACRALHCCRCALQKYHWHKSYNATLSS